MPTAPPAPYPVRLDGRLEAPLSRGLWLVKVFLVIPHLVVLTFLGVAAFVLTVAAWFSIVFTGRYPRPIFDFTVGVMRWGWRVAFYSFSGFATDRYPPFSLQPDPSYPADLEIDYPQRLSRGLVWVKWLLAIPQLIVVGLLSGGFGVHTFGLVSLLAIVAGAVLLFTATYPPDVFDLVMGLNRWCYRVFAYFFLLRDEYPPFRLDLGGTDPGSAAISAPPRHGAG